MSNASYTISLVVGDWGEDGHQKTESINISSNLSIQDLEEAYRKGSNQLGFDLYTSVARDYEDNGIDYKFFAKLKSAGFKFWEYKKASEVYLDPEMFAEIYLFITKLGNSSFEYRILTLEEFPAIRIGGYGLFE